MKKQSGFTLIEMVVVMVILGILAAVALPKFVNMTGQARMAKMQGAVGAVQSSITLVHAKWLAMGSPAPSASGTKLQLEGAELDVFDDMLNGYPKNAAFESTNNIAGLDSSFSVKTGTISDKDKIGCSFSITESAGAGKPPVVDTTNLTEAKCQ